MSFTPVFFDTLFPAGDSQGTDLGYVTITCYPEGKYNPKGSPTQPHSFAWPSQREQLIAWCNQNEKLDLFVAPCLFTAPMTIDEKYVGRRWAVCASTGTMGLSRLLAEPTIVVAVAPGEHQVYWVTDHSVAADAERTSQTIAYEHVSSGCLTDSYASVTQMRVPGTMNSSRGCEVQATQFGLPMSRGSLRSAYPDISDEEAGVPLEPMPESWWCTTASTLESRAVRKVSRPVDDLCGNRATKREQEGLDRLLTLLSQHGVSKPTALHMAWEAACNPHRDPSSKWGGDTDGETTTWKDVLRIYSDPANAAVPRMRERVTSMLSVTGGSPEIARPEFVSDDEAMRIGVDSFISRYERWAATQTDAPTIYHRLNAVMMLSAVFGEFGACPNGDRLTIWGMILGPTTWARKTTAMNLYKDVLASTHERKFPSYYIASDFTKEALAVSLAGRTGRSSLVARDEADGMFEEIFKSPAKSGTIEALTDLFNGRVPRRIRVGDGSAEDTNEGEQIEEATTNFVLYTCATTARMTRVLTEELIKSGFLTRFLYAVADPGEPVEGSLYLDLTGDDDEDELFGDPERESLVRELCLARAYWHNERGLEPGAFKRIRFTREANDRWNVFQDYVIRYCPDPSMKELIRPMAARLAFAVMRLSVLLAMAERQVKVDIDHVLRAIQYSEEWFQSAYTVATRITGNAGYDAQERILATIKELSERGTVTEAEVFRRFRRNMEYPDFKKHLKALETASIIQTAMDPKKRDTVRITYLGK